LIDGNSSDKTMCIVNEFSQCFSHIESTSDSGQSDAINKGVKLARGSYFSWLNSDDFYEPSIMDLIISEISRADGRIVSFGCNFFSSKIEKNYILEPKNIDYHNVLPFWLRAFNWAQPATFFPLDREVVVLNTDYHLAMDYDLLLRVLKRSKPAKLLTHVVVNFRVHNEAKTALMGYKIAEEVPRIIASNDVIGITSTKEYDKFIIRCNIILAKRAISTGNFLMGLLILLKSFLKSPLFQLYSILMFIILKYIFHKPVDFFKVK
jgi:glycosyltransferase involved in cell wall biosynthesis